MSSRVELLRECPGIFSKRREKILLCFLLLGTFILLLMYLSFWTDPQYALIIDAGSTGSRLYVFSVDTKNLVPDHPEEFDTKNIRLHPEYSNKQEPGMSAIPLNQQAFLTYFQTLFSKFPVHKFSAIHLHLAATGGVRRMPLASRLKLQELTNIALYHMGIKDPKIEIISGEVEGIYAWLSINYLKKSLFSPDSWGILDLGGSSFQATWEISQAEAKNYKHTPITIHNKNGHEKTIYVYSASVPGLGTFEGNTKHVASIIKKNQSNDHCSLRGTSNTYDNNGRVISDGKRIIGDGNMKNCIQYTERFIKTTEPISDGITYFGKLVGPDIRRVTKFYGLSEMRYIPEVAGISGRLTAERLEGHAKEFCSQTLLEVTEIYRLKGQEDQIKFLDNHCFKCCWLTNILKRGLGLNLSSVNLEYSPTIGENEAIWAYGCVLKYLYALKF